MQNEDNIQEGVVLQVGDSETLPQNTEEVLKNSSMGPELIDDDLSTSSWVGGP